MRRSEALSVTIGARFFSRDLFRNLSEKKAVEAIFVRSKDFVEEDVHENLYWL